MLKWTEELRARYPETYAYCMSNPGLFANQRRREPGSPPTPILPREEVKPPSGDVLDTQAQANVFFFNRPKNEDT